MFVKGIQTSPTDLSRFAYATALLQLVACGARDTAPTHTVASSQRNFAEQLADPPGATGYLQADDPGDLAGEADRAAAAVAAMHRQIFEDEVVAAFVRASGAVVGSVENCTVDSRGAGPFTFCTLVVERAFHGVTSAHITVGQHGGQVGSTRIVEAATTYLREGMRAAVAFREVAADYFATAVVVLDSSGRIGPDGFLSLDDFATRVNAMR